MDLMPGTKIAAGRSAEALPLSWQEARFGMSLKVEPLNQPRGISMPSGVSQTYVNPEIRASTRAGVTVESVDALMKNQMQYSVFERTAKEQRVTDVIPRNVEQKPAALGNIEEILRNIQKSQKRAPKTAPVRKPRLEESVISDTRQPLIIITQCGKYGEWKRKRGNDLGCN